MQEEFPLHWIPSVLHRFVFLYLFVGFNEFLRADICICSSCFCHVSLILIYNSCLMPKSDLLTEPKAVEIAQLLCIFSVHPFLMSIFCDPSEFLPSRDTDLIYRIIIIIFLYECTCVSAAAQFVAVCSDCGPRSLCVQRETTEAGLTVFKAGIW